MFTALIVKKQHNLIRNFKHIFVPKQFVKFNIKQAEPRIIVKAGKGIIVIVVIEHLACFDANKVVLDVFYVLFKTI